MSAPACAACGDEKGRPLCNLYSLTKGQQAIRELAGAMRDRTGNLPPLPSIFPDYAAPIARTQPDGRELTMARWGMPSPVFALKGKKSDTAVTNVRNVKSPHLETLAWGRELVCRAFHKLLRERGAAGRRAPSSLVRIRREKAACFLCGRLDTLDLRPKSEGRREPI
jgi:hypothetical protein